MICQAMTTFIPSLQLHPKRKLCVHDASISSSPRRPRPKNYSTASLNPLPSDPFPTLPQLVSNYNITHVVARQSPAVLYHATTNIYDDSDDDRQRQQQQQTSVTCKVLPLSALPSWHAVDNLNYEAQLLERLSHPAIPQYIELLQYETSNDCLYVLVTSSVKGQQLLSSIDSYPSHNLPSLLYSLLHALQYLSTLLPAVSHSNISAANIFVHYDDDSDDDDDDSNNNDYERNCITLLNFLPPDESSLVNMQPQQPSSSPSPSPSSTTSYNPDLYAVAITLLSVITGQPPEFFPMTELNTPDLSILLPPLFSSQYPSTYLILTRLLHPITSHRLQTATDAMNLFNQSKMKNHKNQKLNRINSISNVNVNSIPNESISSFLSSKRDDISRTLILNLYPKGTTMSTIAGTIFSIAWTTISLSMAFAPTATIASRIISTAFAFGGFPIASSAWAQRNYQSTLHLTVCPVKKHVSFHRQDSLQNHNKSLYTTDMTFSPFVRANITVITTNRDEHTSEVLILSDGIQTHSFSFPLSRNEMAWFKHEMNQFLDLHTADLLY